MDHDDFFNAAREAVTLALTLAEGTPPKAQALVDRLRDGPDAVSPDDLRRLVCDFYGEIEESLERHEDEGPAISLADICGCFPPIGLPLEMITRDALAANGVKPDKIGWVTRGGLRSFMPTAPEHEDKG